VVKDSRYLQDENRALTHCHTQTLDERHPGFQISGPTMAKHLLNLPCTPCTRDADGPMETFGGPSFSLNGRMEGVLRLGLHLCGQVPP
jgi:hypothetical protein